MAPVARFLFDLTAPAGFAHGSDITAMQNQICSPCVTVAADISYFHEGFQPVEAMFPGWSVTNLWTMRTYNGIMCNG
jgi:hypothetical protein